MNFGKWIRTKFIKRKKRNVQDEEKEEWKVDDEYLNKISESEAKFIFEHTEKQLKDTLDTNTLITNKTTTLVTLIVGLLAALFGFEVNRWDKNHIFDPLLISAIFGCVYLFAIAIILTLIIHPKQYYILGSEPVDFFCGQFFEESVLKEDRQKFIYINEIEDYYKRLSSNKKANTRRGKLYKLSLYLTVFSPAVFITVYLFSTWVM